MHSFCAQKCKDKDDQLIYKEKNSLGKLIDLKQEIKKKKKKTRNQKLHQNYKKVHATSLKKKKGTKL